MNKPRKFVPTYSTATAAHIAETISHTRCQGSTSIGCPPLYQLRAEGIFSSMARSAALPPPASPEVLHLAPAEVLMIAEAL
jgi:hypothetical protein